ncbi:MAG: hypothetical protein ACOC9P_00350 [bacterium]
MSTHSFDPGRSTENVLLEEIHAGHERLRRIVQMDAAELDHIVDRLLPELADALRRVRQAFMDHDDRTVDPSKKRNH